MRRSSRRSTMGVSIHNSLDFDSRTSNKINTRRSSSILPNFEESRNVVGNFSTKFSMSSFVKRVEELNTDQRTAIERVGFGNLLRIHQHTLRKNLLIEWIDRWDCDKRAFVLHDKELTISALDAALILGLRAAGKPVRLLSNDKPLLKLEEGYGATVSSRRIIISELEHRLQSLGDVADEEFTRTFLLFVFGTILFPSPNAKIDSRYLNLLEDLEEVSHYSWGTAVVEDLFSWLSKRKEEQTKSMEGCLLLLQIWSYEHIEIGRPNVISCPLDFPRACRWESSRCNIPRHWFTTKFNELKESQVTWKMRPTEIELTIDIVRELRIEEAGAEATILPSTNITMSMTTELPHKTLCQNAVLDEEPEGCMGGSSRDHQADIPENSGLSLLTEETGGQVVLSTKTSTKPTSVKTGLPPKSATQISSQHDVGDKEPGRGKGRSKLDIPADIQEDSRHSTDASVLTDDFTECSSSYGLQEDQIAETSHSLKGERCLKFEKFEPSEVVELRRKYDALRCQVVPELEQVIAKLKKETAELKAEVADLKEDNARLRAPPPADNIEKLISAYFDGVTDAYEVDCPR